DYQVRYATLVALGNETRDNPALKQMFGLSDQIRKAVADMDKTVEQEEKNFKLISILRTIGSTGLREFYPYLNEALRAEQIIVARAAVHAAGQTLDETFIPLLMPMLKAKEFEKDASEALANYGYKVIQYLHEHIMDQPADIDIVRAIPGVVERIGTQAGVDFLFELLDYDDIIVRSEAVRSLSAIKNQNPHLLFNKKQIIRNILDEARIFQDTLTALYVQHDRISRPVNDPLDEEIIHEARTSLIRLLEKRLDENLDRIFKFLGLKYPPEEIDIIYKGIKSPKTELRVSAIEFLDNLLEINLKRILIPIIETSVEESLTKDKLAEMKIKVVSQRECFSMLLQGRDIKVKLAVFYLLSVLKDKKYLPIVQKYVGHPNARISSAARRASETLKNG
ncbi:MAG TPA: hypothetical protein VK994_06490, partial [Bacteroidales bacterium]|nr:hypothetical protein [Bacteroidales bacterium]